jgi:hypothetical protein
MVKRPVAWPVRARNVVAIVAVLLAAPVSAQTLFTTEDYRQDRERWTDPAYYRHNTARELTDMQVDNRFGQEGSKADRYEIKSPYPFKDSWEHFQAWRQQARGGTTHTLATLPDWDGQWSGGASWLDSRNVQASTIAAALTAQYREYYVQQVKAEAEGRHWWPASFCLPDGFVRGVQGAEQFLVRPNQVVVINQRVHETQVRWVHTDGRGHTPEDAQYPQWQGESIGFWDGGALIVHTNQIRQWNATHSMFEWSDRLTAVERYERIGDAIEGEITLYDPIAFLQPLHARLRFTLEKNPDSGPMYNTCTDTNGPSSNIFATADGVLDERVAGDPGYWDPKDPRPWAAHYAVGEQRERERRRAR